MLAAVVRPLTISPRAKIAPAPRKPIPDTTCAATREGSRMTFGPRTEPKPYADTIMNKQAPTHTSMCVRMPAAHSRRSRSKPIRLPRTAASNSRNKVSAYGSMVVQRDWEPFDPVPDPRTGTSVRAQKGPEGMERGQYQNPNKNGRTAVVAHLRDCIRLFRACFKLCRCLKLNAPLRSGPNGFRQPQTFSI